MMQCPAVLDSFVTRAILDNLQDGVCLVKPGRQVIYWSAGAERLTGYRAEEVVGRYCYDNILAYTDMDGAPLTHHRCLVLLTLEDLETRTAEVFMLHRDGHRVPVTLRVAPVHDERGRLEGVVEVISDNSAAVAAHERADELERLAMLDPLTQVANRRYLEEVVQANLAQVERYGRPFGVLLADIDHFKAINDRHGHVVGDDVLRMVAHALRNGLRPFDLVGRWGGEEFMVSVVSVEDREHLERVGDRLRRLVERSRMQPPLPRVRATVSIGGALARKGETAWMLVERADQRLYEAKSRGRNMVCV